MYHRHRRVDYTNSLPDECLALIFNFLTTSKDRNNSSLVSHRWLRIEAQTRTHLSLNARSNLRPFIRSIFTRFNSLTQLVLHCDPKSSSINNHGLRLITCRCPNLTCLKLRACPGITDKGMAILSQNCKKLKKFSFSSCGFRTKGIMELLNSCSSLEELSVKFLDTGRELSEIWSIGSSNLKTLKLIALSGDWDRFLRMIAVSANSLVEVHLGNVDVTYIGLFALSRCSNLQVLHLDGLLDCPNDGLISVAEHFKNLKKLYIDNRMHNVIRNEALIAIANYCFNLEELVLIGVDVCRISLQAVAVNCQKLERLDLCSSKTITDVEISYIAEKCVALKKLLIKECRVSDKGVEAFALGCPNLVELRLTKCENVTHEVKDRLRDKRGSLVVKLDEVRFKAVNAIIGDSGVPEHVAEVPPAADLVAVTEP